MGGRPLAVFEAARAGAMAEVERRVRRGAGPRRVTGEVLEAARTLDPVAFGRRVRRDLAEDGGVAFSGLAYGTAAELARTALDAFHGKETDSVHPLDRAANGAQLGLIDP